MSHSPYPPGVSDSDIDEHFGPDVELERLSKELEEAEEAFLSGLARLQGTFRAMLTVGQMPGPDARREYLVMEACLMPLWSAYKAALAAFEEASR